LPIAFFTKFANLKTLILSQEYVFMSHQHAYIMRPLKDVVLMPKATIPIMVERNKFKKNWENLKKDSEIIILTQKNNDEDAPPTMMNMYLVGTLAKITHDDSIIYTGQKIICQGLRRFAVTSITVESSGPMVTGHFLETEIICTKTIEASKRAAISKINKLIKASILKRSSYEEILNLQDPEQLLDMLINQLAMSLSMKQELLETISLEDRYIKVLSYLAGELEIDMTNKRLAAHIRESVSKRQKEYFDQLKNEAIKAEFGEENEIDVLERRIHETGMPPEAKTKAESELKKLRNMNAMSSEAVVVRHYLELLCDLPWNERSELEENLSVAHKSLDQNHYGLPKIKDEISKHIAVYNRTKGNQGTVLCLVGPPGVGKTSLGKSIASATNRKFARIALGGVKDEAEIRGHRRTYVGSMPGKIIQEIKRCGSINPLFMLDEIDKIGQDWRGDPAAGLLEVLDPEQNGHFVDHYLEVSFPLNECMFVCTANDINKIPVALLDRMEVIELSSYTQEEKFEIAKKHLIKKQMTKNGLEDSEFSMSDGALSKLISEYTREAGVRELDRKIKSLTSQAVLLIDTKKTNQLSLSKVNLEKYAGIPPYSSKESSTVDQIGIINGMAWSTVGGSLLTIESVLVPGDGKIVSTGRLGDVMKESVTIAFGYLRSMAEKKGWDLSALKTNDIHVHVPEGAIPKDGPSAGVAISLSILSALLKMPISSSIAVTGEISLTGQVWAIGGLKEKILAAHRNGVKTIMIPFANKKNIEDIPASVLSSLNMHYIKHADEALEVALPGYAHTFGPSTTAPERAGVDLAELSTDESDSESGSEGDTRSATPQNNAAQGKKDTPAEDGIVSPEASIKKKNKK